MFPIWAKRVLIVCLFCLGFSAEARVDDTAVPSDCSGERGFCAEVERYAKRLRVPGYALAVARDGRIVHLQTQGYADIEQRRPVRADSIFPIASVTKTFTAALMMQYVQEGRIRLDDYLADYPQIDDAAAWIWSSPDIRIRHVLSHTSEGAEPGGVFTYNGNRFNYVYGVFAKMSGEKDYARAFAGEVKARILDRLGLADTLTEFPDATNDAHAARIVTPYRYDSKRGAFVADDDLQGGHRHAYPNSGMLSTLADLARYADALDRSSLLDPASVATMTAPFKLADGSDAPYGLGWFSEVQGGVRLDWVYGLGPSYSSFLLHVPSERLSLIFLANNDGPTAALRLNYGDALQFPLSAPFLRRFTTRGKGVPELGLDEDVRTLETSIARMPAAERDGAIAQVVGIALTQHYVEKTYGGPSGKAKALVQMLYRVDPGYFRTLHADAIGLIGDIADPALIEPMNDLAAAYTRVGHVDPRISQDLGDFYARVGLDAASVEQRAKLVATAGYETNDATIAAAFELGDRSFNNGDIAAGRNYYWTGIHDAVAAGWSTGSADAKRQRMNALTHATVAGASAQ
jgi:CubicO group peptidase (beta-lactamase class C family)